MEEQQSYIQVHTNSMGDNLTFHRANILISVTTVIIYSLLFFALYHYLMNGIVSGVALAPAVIIGWLYGKRGGLLGGIFLSFWNMLLFILVGAPALQLTFFGPGVLGSLFLISVGGFAGWLRDLLQKTRQQADQLALEVSERKRVEQELRTNEAYIRAGLSAFPDMLFVLDQDGTLLTHHAHKDMDLYVQPEDIMGNNIRDVMPPEFVSLCLQNITQALETSTVQVFEYTLSMPKGVEDYEARLVSIDDKIVLAVVRNITHQKQVQRHELMMATQQERIKVLNELINNLSHDFKTPLSIINTSVYLLHRQPQPKELKRQLQKIQYQSTRLQKYIESILIVSQLDNEVTLSLVSLDLSYWLQPLENKFQPMAKKQSIDITFCWEKPIPLILGDQHSLIQAINHLIENALIYNVKDGQVTVRCYVKDHQVIIEIKDTGIGIEPEHQAHIFERFYRVDPARGGEAGGIGLGLAIVQKVVELHEGRIEVESQVNQGSIFRIYLPIAGQRRSP